MALSWKCNSNDGHVYRYFGNPKACIHALQPQFVQGLRL